MFFMKTWKLIENLDCCDDCGCSDVEVLCESNGDYFDGSDARCLECGCLGMVSVVDSTYIDWDDGEWGHDNPNPSSSSNAK